MDPTQKKPKIPDRVNAAIEKIREFYRIGKEAPRNTRYGNHEIKKAAGELGMNEATFRIACVFATHETGYTPTELEDLIRQIKEHNYGDKKWVLGISHVSRLLSISKANQERLKLQQEAIDNKWSCAKLDDVIRLKFGTRKKGGRKRQVPGDAAGVLNQVEQECDRWERWWESLNRPVDKDKPTERPPALKSLTPEIQKRLRKLTDKVRNLKNVAEAERKQLKNVG